LQLGQETNSTAWRKPITDRFARNPQNRPFRKVCTKSRLSAQKVIPNEGFLCKAWSMIDGYLVITGYLGVTWVSSGTDEHTLET